MPYKAKVKMTNSVRGLAKALKLSENVVFSMIKESWFPRKSSAGLWDIAACRQAIRENRLHKFDRVDPIEKAPDAGADGIDPQNEFVKILMGDGKDPVAIARATLSMASQQYGRGLIAGATSARMVDNIKKALAELRTAEHAYMKIAEKKKELISRDVAKETAGLLVQRLLAVLNNVENLLTTQVLIWLDSSEFKELNTESQQRAIRNWFHEQAREVRKIEVDEIERIIGDLV